MYPTLPALLVEPGGTDLGDVSARHRLGWRRCSSAPRSTLCDALPEEPLTGELPVDQVRRMMFADQLAFGAVEWLRPRDADGLAALAMQFQHAAIATTARGAHT